MSHRTNVLRAYRDLLELINCLPADKRSVALWEARQRTREGAAESNAVKKSDLLKELVARASFLRASTPRTSWRQRALKQPTHYVFRGGKLVEGHGQAETRYRCDSSRSSHNNEIPSRLVESPGPGYAGWGMAKSVWMRAIESIGSY